jgi:hypothetical protein
MTTSAWGRFELPAAASRLLAARFVAWTVAAMLMAGALVGFGVPDTSPLVIALAVAAGAMAARPAALHLLPLVALVVTGVALGLGRAGVPIGVAAGIAAGLAVGSGSTLARVEAVLAGAAGGGFGHLLATSLPVVGVPYALALGGLVGLATAQALLPGALRFAARSRLPPGRIIGRTLAPDYRTACYRAIHLDAELVARAPDPATREGLREVASWVYRLALTLQTLDGDLAAIDPDDIATRRAALEGDDGDPFVVERRRATRGHLDRLLQHRAVLARERARAASLQEYALAWLEEARAGLAVAQRLPGEATPDGLRSVLERLRAHAADAGVQRETVRELGVLAEPG